MPEGNPVSGSEKALLAGIETFHAAGRYEEVVAHTSRALEGNPGNPDFHYVRGLALICLERIKEAQKHVEFVLESEPNEPRSYHLAAVYYLKSNDSRLAEEFITTAIEGDPEWPVYHYIAAQIAMATYKFDEAKAHIKTAIELDPNDSDYVNLSVLLDGVGEKDLATWRRIERLAGALKQDPTNADVYAQIGRIHLDELDCPGIAEGYFREALRLRPANRQNQKLLFEAVGQQSLIYRVISTPMRSAATVMKGLKAAAQTSQWTRYTSALAYAPFYLAWLLVSGAVFWPAAKVYEWLLIAEVWSGSATPAAILRTRQRVHGWPFKLRLGLFAGSVCIFWIALFWSVTGSATMGLLMLAVFIGAHFSFVQRSLARRKARAEAAKND